MRVLLNPQCSPLKTWIGKDYLHFKKEELQKYEKDVFGRATAANISIASGCLPLSTKYHMQRTILNVASASKVKTRDGVIDMREAGVNKKSVNTFCSSNNRLTDIPFTVAIYITSPVKTVFTPNTIDMTSSTSSGSMQSKYSSCETPTLQPEDVKANLSKVMSERVLTRARSKLTGLLNIGKKRSVQEDGGKTRDKNNWIKDAVGDGEW